MGRPKLDLDLESVDWANESNKEIAKRLGCSVSYVSKKRLEGDHPKSPFHKRRPAFARFANVDWSRNDVDIAKDLGVTRERIRQVRKGLNKPKVTPKHIRVTLEVERRILDAMSTDKTTQELASELGFRYNYVRKFITRLKCKGFKIKVKPSWGPGRMGKSREKYDWDSVDWVNESNEDIAARLGCSLEYAYQKRRNGDHHRGPNTPLDSRTRYANVDWSRNDTDIADDFGVTRQRITKVREELGKAKATPKHENNTLEAEKRVLEAMSPDKTRQELAEELGFRYGYVSKLMTRLRRKGVKIEAKVGWKIRSDRTKNGAEK